MLETAVRVGISQPGVVHAVRRGECTGKERDTKLRLRPSFLLTSSPDDRGFDGFLLLGWLS